MAKTADTNREPARVASITDISRSFPQLSGGQVPRDNLLQLVDTILEDVYDLVSVEGLEGIGKTTLLVQYARRHAQRCFSVFIRPSSRFAYDPAIVLHDICDQINWVLRGTELPPAQPVNDAIYQQLIMDLQRHARHRDRYYFIVDGLEEIPKEGPQVQDIAELLPIGLPQFKFVVSGSVDNIPGLARQKIQRKAITIPPFSLDEAIRFFSELSVPDPIVGEFQRACKGVPSHLAVLRRLLSSGTTAETLIDELPVTLSGLFEIEWGAVDKANHLQVETLAVLSFDRRKHTVTDLAQVLETEPETIKSCVAPLTFVTISESDGEVDFVSESFRRFAGLRLQDRREPIRTQIIESLLKRPESSDALAFLPTYLEEAGRLDDLVDFLSPEHFTAMIESSESLRPVQQKAELGLTAALKLDRDGEILRFGLERSVIEDPDASGISRSEIKARMALGEYKASLALAESAVVKEDRLRLLAAIARLRREAGFSPEPELVEQITLLFNDMNKLSIGENLSELAADLMFSRPDLAIQLAEQGTMVDPSLGEPSVDWSLAQLSVVAAMGKKKASEELSKTAEEIRQRIKDPAALGVSAAVSMLIGDYSASDVLRETGKLERAKDQLFLLRMWAENTRHTSRAGDVIDFALKLAVKTTEYVPIATDLRQLATPLPSVQDISQRRGLVGTFDTQKATAQELGPTDDFVRLQLFLLHAESTYDPEAATRRLLEAYYFVADIANLEVKATCLARLVAALPEIDPKSSLSDTHEVLETSTEELRECVRKLLESTADHYLSSRSVIEALAKKRPDLAVGFIQNLNTATRRDSALDDFYEKALSQPSTNIPLQLLNQCLDRFWEHNLRDGAVNSVLARMAKSSGERLTKLLDQIVPFIGRIRDIDNSDMRCRSCCHALTILSKSQSSSYPSLRDNIQEILEAAWNQMELSREKVNTGFYISSSLAPYSRDEASKYLVLTDALRKTAGMNSSTASYTACIRLAIRAYSGLLPKHFDSEVDLEHLTTQIERVISDQSRIFLWTDLALKFLSVDRIAEGRKTISERVRPLLDTIGARNHFEWQYALKVCAPALYQNHKTSAVELMRKLDPPIRDEALGNAIVFILRKVWRFEPFELKSAKSRYQLSYEEALDICELMEEVDEDSDIYSYITSVVESALWKQNRFSQQQKADLAQRLSAAVEKKLPNRNFIAHEGYKILCQAFIARLVKKGQVEDLISKARTIANVSDRAFILAQIASYDSSLDFSLRVALLKEAKACTDQIPADLSRAFACEMLAEAASEVDQVLCKQCLKEAYRLIPREDVPEAESLRRQIVDFAHGLDPDLASAVATSLDDDQARKEIRSQIAMKDFQKKLGDGTFDEVPRNIDGRKLARIAWSLLGQLNAGRLEPLSVSVTRPFVKLASSYPLSEAFPMLSWVIENAVSRRKHSEEAKRLLRGIYEGSLVGCELAIRLGGRMSGRLQKLIVTSAEPLTSGSFIVRAGEREKALAYLGQWLSENVRESLKICDPFFGPEDLDLLQLILRSADVGLVSILTSRKHQENCGDGTPLDEQYRNCWKRLSDQSPPPTEIVVVGNSRGELPIHDRWWITNGAGLRIGSSFNALGGRKECEISCLDQSEAAQFEAEIDEFLSLRKREHCGDKLSTFFFTL